MNCPHIDKGLRIELKNGTTLTMCADCAGEQVTYQASETARVIRAMTPAELVERRNVLHLSQAELARRLGVAANTVNRWEAGTRTIPPYLDLTLDGIQHQHIRAGHR